MAIFMFFYRNIDKIMLQKYQKSVIFAQLYTKV